MTKKLRYSVHVRETKPIDPKAPEKGSNVVKEQWFNAGETLPAWAAKLVDDHVYEPDEDDEPDESDESDDDDK